MVCHPSAAPFTTVQDVWCFGSSDEKAVSTKAKVDFTRNYVKG